ncbi:MarR family winged helix-turn-helix transcriptional regulator [Flavitalea flava]
MVQNPVNAIRSFNRFYTNIIGLLDRHLLDSPFSLSEARVLYELYHQEGLLAGDIVSNLKMDKSYLSRMLDQFTRKQLITRSRSATDARAVHIFLTAKGKKEAEALGRASTKQIADILGGISEIQTKQLVHYMQEIQKILSASTVGH